MKNQVVALFKGTSRSRITVHKSIFDAQRDLLDFAKSPECKDIPESVKAQLETYADFETAAVRSATEGKWDAFVLTMKAVTA